MARVSQGIAAFSNSVRCFSSVRNSLAKFIMKLAGHALHERPPPLIRCREVIIFNHFKAPPGGLKFS